MRRYTYDANNNMLSSCNHLWDNVNGWYIFPDSTWRTYNSNNQITETATSFDGGGGNHGWYFYDGQNRPDSGLYITWPHGGDTHYWYYKMEYPILNSINKTEGLQNLKVYPNPSNDIFYFDNSSTILKLELFDLHGKMLNQFREYQIDLTEYENGIYFYKAYRNHDEVIFGKLIKVN